MNKRLNVALAGPGAFGIKHLEGIKQIPEVRVVSLIGRELSKTKQVAERYGIEQATTRLEDALVRPEIDAVILCTPTPLHADQALACLRAGKHVQVEVPLADTLEDAEAVLALTQETGLIAMVGHTRRYNPSHQYVRQRIQTGAFKVQHLDVQTYFFRRENLNAEGGRRSWTDHLLWHHAAHTVDLFTYQTGGKVVKAQVLQGPIHPELGIAMDMSIQLLCSTGALCTLSLSFNNQGQFGSFYRYIGDSATYVARYDDLFTGYDEQIDVSKVDVSMNGIELQDREFFSAIQEKREPRSSVSRVLPCYRVLHDLAQQLLR